MYSLLVGYKQVPVAEKESMNESLEWFDAIAEVVDNTENTEKNSGGDDDTPSLLAGSTSKGGDSLAPPIQPKEHVGEGIILSQTEEFSSHISDIDQDPRRLRRLILAILLIIGATADSDNKEHCAMEGVSEKEFHEKMYLIRWCMEFIGILLNMAFSVKYGDEASNSTFKTFKVMSITACKVSMMCGSHLLWSV